MNNALKGLHDWAFFYNSFFTPNFIKQHYKILWNQDNNSKLIVMGIVLRAARNPPPRKIKNLPLNFNKNITSYLSFATKSFQNVYILEEVSFYIRIVLVTSQCLQTKTFISEFQLYLLFNPFQTGMSSLDDFLSEFYNNFT